MSPLTIALLLGVCGQVVPVDSANSVWARESQAREQAYANAHAESMKDGVAFVVMVGAPWCEHCVAQENEFTNDTNVSFVHIDRDDPTGMRLVSRGGTIPQTFVFWRVAGAWRGHRFVGRITPKALEDVAAEKHFTIRRRRR